MPIGNLEKYLTEPMPLVGKLSELKEKIGEYQQKIDAIENLETVTSNLVKGIKNPENHSGRGVIGLYNLYKVTLEGYEMQKADIGEEGYTIKVNGTSVKVTPENTLSIWEYRLDWTGEALKGLVFIYKDDITKTIEEMQKIQTEMKEEFGL